ncbi:MAG: hypothetical protein ACXW2E_01170 [Nitrososphaeraceae archaeon]
MTKEIEVKVLNGKTLNILVSDNFNTKVLDFCVFEMTRKGTLAVPQYLGTDRSINEIFGVPKGKHRKNKTSKLDYTWEAWGYNESMIDNKYKLPKIVYTGLIQYTPLPIKKKGLVSTLMELLGIR